MWLAATITISLSATLIIAAGRPLPVAAVGAHRGDSRNGSADEAGHRYGWGAATCVGVVVGIVVVGVCRGMCMIVVLLLLL